MLSFTYMTLLLLFGTEDAGSRKAVETSAVIPARLREPLTVDCTFNCSSGFIHGLWTWEDTPACTTCNWETQHGTMSKGMCTVSLFTPNLTMEQTVYNYSCVSIMSDHQDLPRKTERLVSLQIEDKTTATVSLHEAPVALTMKVEVYRNEDNYSVDRSESGSLRVSVGTQLQLKCLSNDKRCAGQWMRDHSVLPNPNPGPLLRWAKITKADGGSYNCHAKPFCAGQGITVTLEVIKDDDSGWVRIVAAIVLSAAVVLMLKLIFLCYKKSRRLEESEPAVIYENTRPKNECAALKPLAQECQSDHEVPYADIVISVRGSSIPEFTGVQNHTPRDPRLRWRDDAASGIQLHACRSADRLHVHPKEVSRKLSTASEYAVITYSAEAIG